MIAQELDRRVHQRHGAHLASLAHEPHLWRWIQAHIASVEVDQLLHPSAGVVEYAQQACISAARTRMRIGLGEDLREYFRHDEVTQRRSRSRRELIDGMEQLLNLSGCKDAW